ncbi:MAG: right-handed parallel beta-helix repeat-containing protein, partial [Gemmatimonadetes bacterium]|nr:right-handed parallel beta-helix repeat-containing protein [Gemmatimonadota bacterium]
MTTGARLCFAAPLVAGLAVAGLVPARLPAQSIPVIVGGPASSLVGVPFELPIQVDLSARTDRLGSFAIRLQWNPAVLRIDSGVNGDFGEVYAHEDSMPLGVLRLTGANPLGVLGRVTLGTGYGEPLVADTTTIRVQVLELYAAKTFTDLLPHVAASNRLYCPALGRYGDLEADNTITARDAQIALMAAVGLPLPQGTQVATGDVDGDGVTDTRDALIILSRVVALETGHFRLLRVTPGACGADKLFALALPPGNQNLVAGQQIQYVARAIDSTENAAVLTGVRWASSNTAVATVDGVGRVTALASGQAVITATESGGRQGSATVTVVTARRRHAVDALAVNATNQLGSAELPFSRIQDAVAFSQPGDTVLIRTGRYEGRIAIEKNLTLLGPADSGAVRPLISGKPGTPADSSGVHINGGPRVELRGLRFDTLYQAVTIRWADTVFLTGVAFRARSASVYTVFVDSVRALRVRRSRFDGAASPIYANSAVYVNGWAQVLSVDSTLITDYGDDALTVYGVDSLIVKNSVLRNNRGYGVYAYNALTADADRVMRTVFSRNLFVQNTFGHVYLYDYASAAFDHNVMVGIGYDGIELYGDPTSLVSFLGDTLATRGGYWLYASVFDSLAVDSVTVKVGDYGGYMIGGRVAVVRNSVFDSAEDYYYYYYALQVQAGSRPSSHLVLRKVAFRGSRQCDRCRYGVYAYNTSIDADGVTGDNLYSAFYKSNLDLTLKNSSFTRVYYLVDSDCGNVRVDNLTATDAYYPLQVYGCSPDSLIVENSSFDQAYQAISTSYADLVVRNTALSRAQYAIYGYSGTLLAEDNRITDPFSSYYGVYFDADGGAVTLRRNTVTCDPADYQYGMQLYDGAITVADNSITGCRYAVYVANGSGVPAGTPIEVRNNDIGLPGGGIWGILSGGSTEAVRVVKNRITGPAAGYGSIVVGYSYANPVSVVDSNTITGSYDRGIWARYSDTLRILDNTITGHLGGTCCTKGAIVLDAAAASNASAQVLRNRINLTKSHGIVLYRAFGDTVTVLVDSNKVKGADSMGV